MRVARRACECGVQQLHHCRLALQRCRQHARRHIVRVVAQSHAAERAQHQLRIIGANANAQTHVGELDAHMHSVVRGDDAAHQHITTTAGVLGERMGRYIHRHAAAIGEQVKRLESQARAPGVVQHGGHAARAAGLNQGDQVRELHAHAAWRLQPYQLGGGRDFGLQVGDIHRVVPSMANAPARQLMLCKVFVRPIGIVGNQHLVAGAKQAQRYGADSTQAAGHQQALLAALQTAQTLFQLVGGGRAMQAIGEPAFIQPAARAHVVHAVENDGRCFVHCGLYRSKGWRGLVAVVYQVGGDVACLFLHAAMLSGKQP